MSLKAVKAAWANDCRIDITKLTDQALDVPKLHSKYYELLLDAQKAHQAMDHAYKALKKIKTEYYLGLLSKEELKEYGWDQFLKKIIRSDLHIYLDADRDMQQTEIDLKETEQTVKFLESILANIHQRNYTIKNSIDYARFLNGQ